MTRLTSRFKYHKPDFADRIDQGYPKDVSLTHSTHSLRLKIWCELVNTETRTPRTSARSPGLLEKKNSFLTFKLWSAVDPPNPYWTWGSCPRGLGGLALGVLTALPVDSMDSAPATIEVKIT